MTSCCGKRPACGAEHPFRSSLRPAWLTLKFWARHDQFADKPQIAEMAKRHEKTVERNMFYDPRRRFPVPITENQVYGWLERFAFKYEGEERDMFQPRREMNPDLAILDVVYRELAAQRTRKG